MKDISAPLEDALAAAIESQDASDWLAFSALVRPTVPATARAGLAWAALSACETDHVDEVLATFSRHVGAPVATMESALHEAENWASLAARDEIDAYAIACVNRMPRERRQQFLKYLTGVAV